MQSFILKQARNLEKNNIDEYVNSVSFPIKMYGNTRNSDILIKRMVPWEIAMKDNTSCFPLLRGLSSTFEYCLIFPTPIIVPQLFALLCLILVLFRGGGVGVVSGTRAEMDKTSEKILQTHSESNIAKKWKSDTLIAMHNDNMHTYVKPKLKSNK